MPTLRNTKSLHGNKRAVLHVVFWVPCLQGRHHDSLVGELSELVHALAHEDFQSFFHHALPGYVWSAAALPGLDDGQRGALLALLPASASDEPSMKRGLGRLARDASLYLRVNRAALE